MGFLEDCILWGEGNGEGRGWGWVVLLWSCKRSGDRVEVDDGLLVQKLGDAESMTARWGF